MQVVLRSGDIASRIAGAIALACFQGERRWTGPAQRLDAASRGALSRLLATGDFTGRPGEVLLLHPGGIRARRVLLVGLGARADFGPQRIREAAALAARRARELRAGTLALVIPAAGRGEIDPDRAAQAIAEGAVLGHYRFGAYRSDPLPPPLKRIEILEPDAARTRALRPAIERGARWAEATCLARDLAWLPGQDLVPEALAARAREIGAASGARVQVLRAAELERVGMGAVLAVGRGSAHPPCFIVLEWPGAVAPKTPPRRRGRRPAVPAGPAPVVLIGKGVTFDTGGISIKPRENMHKMKYDMSGAAAVLGAFAALPTVAPPFPVVGLIPAAENMPGGRALKPGDVIRTLGGPTVEVTNTDAEGRLLLADAIAYARRYEPEAVIDLATLTGAISIALGVHAAGLFTGDEPLAAELQHASAASGERLWRMPLWEECRAELRSDTADLVNSSGAREGGAVVAAVFLERFARGLRWAHLDIASTAWSPGERPLESRGPTGFGVRLLLEWISRRTAAHVAAQP
jgi:leucyl aminopeptidase